MHKFLAKILNKNTGFTLVELLVVIAIIGVLASIVLASLNNARSKARDSKRTTDVKQLQLALELHFDGLGAGSYPGAIDTANMVTPGYIPQIPVPPTGTTGSCSTAYCYGVPPAGSRTTYHLGVRVENTGGVLTTDKDCNSVANTGCSGVSFAGGTGQFDGADPVFDVQP